MPHRPQVRAGGALIGRPVRSVRRVARAQAEQSAVKLHRLAGGYQPRRGLKLGQDHLGGKAPMARGQAGWRSQRRAWGSGRTRARSRLRPQTGGVAEDQGGLVLMRASHQASRSLAARVDWEGATVRDGRGSRGEGCCGADDPPVSDLLPASASCARRRGGGSGGGGGGAEASASSSHDGLAVVAAVGLCRLVVVTTMSSDCSPQ